MVLLLDDMKLFAPERNTLCSQRFFQFANAVLRVNCLHGLCTAMGFTKKVAQDGACQSYPERACKLEMHLALQHALQMQEPADWQQFYVCPAEGSVSTLQLAKVHVSESSIL